jgi:hypothetical protein
MIVDMVLYSLLPTHPSELQYQLFVTVTKKNKQAPKQLMIIWFGLRHESRHGISKACFPVLAEMNRHCKYSLGAELSRIFLSVEAPHDRNDIADICSTVWSTVLYDNCQLTVLA